MEWPTDHEANGLAVTLTIGVITVRVTGLTDAETRHLWRIVTAAARRGNTDPTGTSLVTKPYGWPNSSENYSPDLTQPDMSGGQHVGNHSGARQYF